jgi:hypothetical protein
LPALMLTPVGLTRDGDDIRPELVDTGGAT